MLRSQAGSVLVQRAIRGDQAAIQELFFIHHDRLVRHIAGKLPTDLRRQGLADDIAQESFSIAFQRISTLDPSTDSRKGLFAWLVAIADHRMLDVLKGIRAAKRGGGRRPIDQNDADPKGQVEELLGLLACDSNTPSRVCAREEAAVAVLQALSAIEPDYRAALRFRYLDRIPPREAATRMNRSEGAYHMMCNRGLAKLREHLGDLRRFFSGA